MPNRFSVAVTFDGRGYVASAEGLPAITALSLAGLRRRIDERLAGQGVIPRLILDKAARVERDQRRAAAVSRLRDTGLSVRKQLASFAIAVIITSLLLGAIATAVARTELRVYAAATNGYLPIQSLEPIW